MSQDIIDIHSKGEYPANQLSNFYPHIFVLDGIYCQSMEGFLQSLKYKNVEKQRKICHLSGKEAKIAGKRRFLWKIHGRVHWNSKSYFRDSQEFEELIKIAYTQMYNQNADFKKALASTIGKTLTHEIGKTRKRETILTIKEYIDCLNMLRENL